METETIIHTALFSGILGFVVFCASYAAHVWRTRSAANRNARARVPGARLQRWGFLSAFLGCLLMLTSLIWREVKPREGMLSGDGLYTVRARHDLRSDYVTDARTVAAGDVLARFVSPERRAEIAELELKEQILEAQRQVVSLQPLTPDGELVRHYEKCVADQRQLLSSLSYLIPEHAVVVREKLRDRLDKTERLNALTTRIDSARREVVQAQARRGLADKHRTRLENLSQSGAAADIERDERTTDSTVQDAEVSRLQESIANMQVERKHLVESIPLFASCTSQQAEDIESELNRIRGQLKSSEQELAHGSEKLERDRARAQQLKAQMLDQLELEVRQCRARLDGIQDVLTIRAPFNGIVAYADPAPANALPDAPVAILAPGEGFRFRLRMSEAEAGALSRCGSVALGLVAPVLQRRFPGRLIRWEKLAHEPGYVVSELACMPPPETIRDLALREWGTREWMASPAIKVRLLWRPPIQASPVFYPAIGMLAVGVIGLFASFLQRSRQGEAIGTEDDSNPASRRPASGIPAELIAPLPATSLAAGAADLESGALGRNLQMLGQRLRESIQRQAVEPSLVSAVEWAIDRHHTRAIEHLALALDHDPDLTSSLHTLMTSRAGESPEAGRSAPTPVDRVLRIVEAVAPELLPEAESSQQPCRSAEPRGPAAGRKPRESGLIQSL